MTGDKVQTNLLHHCKMGLWATTFLGLPFSLPVLCSFRHGISGCPAIWFIPWFSSGSKSRVFCFLLNSSFVPVFCRLAQQQMESPKNCSLNARLFFFYPSPWLPLPSSRPFPNSINIYGTRASTTALASNSEWDFSGFICS